MVLCITPHGDIPVNKVTVPVGFSGAARPLRIDLAHADSDPFPEGKIAVRGELMDSGDPDNKRPRKKDNMKKTTLNLKRSSLLANLPPGI